MIVNSNNVEVNNTWRLDGNVSKRGEDISVSSICGGQGV